MWIWFNRVYVLQNNLIKFICVMLIHFFFFHVLFDCHYSLLFFSPNKAKFNMAVLFVSFLLPCQKFTFPFPILSVPDLLDLQTIAPQWDPGTSALFQIVSQLIYLAKKIP